MPKDFLLEIGAEEIPASFVEPALEDLRRTLTEQMQTARLKHGEPKLFGTPRRLAVFIPGVGDKSEDVLREVLGPSVKAGWADGKPTKAAEKFAESVKLPVAQLLKIQTPKGEYLGAKVHELGRSAEEILKDALHRAVHGINFKKSMRWGDVDVPFARPVHWIVALLGEEVLPVVLGDVRSARTTHGHRFLAPQPITLKNPAAYQAALEGAHVIPDIQKRKAALKERVQKAAVAAHGQVLEDEALFDQVTQLVELPCPVVGSFDVTHLDLPPEVLVQEMKSHQRYFSLVDDKKRLLPKFIAVSNTPVKNVALSLKGYERVLRARLSDGRFFFDEDRKTRLEERIPKLGRVVWQGQLGSYLEKIERFRALALSLVEWTGKSDKVTVERAATLAKADLVTGMVGEFPELQGVMGREYARADGEIEAVALAIFEHYLPRGASDSLPTQDAGALVGVADRLDSLVGLFAIGKVPSGAADPFGLRRACLAITNLVLGRGYRFSLKAAVERSFALYESKLSGMKQRPQGAKVTEQVLEFFRARLKALWSESHRVDVVEAVLAAGFDDLPAAQRRLQALQEIVGRSDFVPLAVAFKRVANIVEKQGKDVSEAPSEPAKHQDEAEKALHAAWMGVRDRTDALLKTDHFAGALKEITSLKAPVDLFFEKVMVMSEDRILRENRVRLLMEIGRLFGRVADFSKIQTEISG